MQRAFAQQPEGSPLMKVSHNAWELLGESSSENIVKGFTMHVDAVTPALLAVVRKLSRDGFNAIVEGVHCYGTVLDQFTQVCDLTVLPRLIVVTSESRLLDYIQRKEEERSYSGESKAWKDHAKTIMKIQDFLIQDAIQHNIPIMCTD
jgi:2-phosphoglycerate kinase